MRAQQEAQEGHRRPQRVPQPVSPAVTTASTASTASGVVQGPGALLELQRSAGNAAVSRALSVQRAPTDTAQDQDQSQDQTVLSGHGRFGDNQRLPRNPDNPRSRALKATFTVPEGIELVVYAPPGAWLENEVAKLVESGAPPGAGDLEMVGPNNKRKPMPPGYPKTFGAGEEVINYKLMPLEARHLAEGATSVEGGTLQAKVKELADARENQGDDASTLTVHYACCGVGASSVPEIDQLFVHRNYTVMMRTTSKSPTPEPSKRRRK